MALTDIAICSKALLKIGANIISSFDEGTAESEVSTNLYPQIRDALLSSHPWSFAIAQTNLPRLASTPVADYKYAYKLPSDFIRVLSAGDNVRSRGLEYKIIEDRLHTNRAEVVLTYIFRPDEKSYPPFFYSCLIARLAAEFCLPLVESTSRTEFLTKSFEAEFKKAKLIDSSQETPDSIDDFTLIEVRS